MADSPTAKTGGGLGGTLGALSSTVLVGGFDWGHHIGVLVVAAVRSQHPDYDAATLDSAQALAGAAASLGIGVTFTLGGAFVHWLLAKMG